LETNRLQLVWNSVKMPQTEVYVLARKNDTLHSILEDVKKEMQLVFS
jgi:hypothetical protein